MSPLLDALQLSRSAKMNSNMDSEENQSEGTDIYIITLGHSYITLEQLKESQEEGIVLD